MLLLFLLVRPGPIFLATIGAENSSVHFSGLLMAHAMIRIEESVTDILYEQWDNSILSQSSKAHSIVSASSRDDMMLLPNYTMDARLAHL